MTVPRVGYSVGAMPSLDTQTKASVEAQKAEIEALEHQVEMLDLEEKLAAVQAEMRHK